MFIALGAITALTRVGGYWLSGRRYAEVTIASTTGLLDPAARRWSASITDALREKLGLPLPRVLPELVEPGTVVGTTRPGLLPGEVRPIAPDLPTPLKLPQIGWNALRLRRPGALIPGVQDGDCVYYVHSYYAKCPDDVVVASSEYGVEVPGVVERGNVVGCQFHPEKSGDVGLSMLAAFARMPGGAPC